MDRMSKFAYPRMRIRMRIPSREAPWMRIHMEMPGQEDPWMRIPVSRYPRMRTRMRICVTYLNTPVIEKCELLLLQNTDY